MTANVGAKGSKNVWRHYLLALLLRRGVKLTLWPPSFKFSDIALSSELILLDKSHVLS